MPASTTTPPHDPASDNNGTSTAPQADAGPEPINETWVYAGVRVLDGKRVHAWIDDHGRGTELLYQQRGSYVIGNAYHARVTRTGKRTSLHGTPDYEGTSDLDRDTIAGLQAQHHAAVTRLALIRQERSAARNDEVDTLLEPLRAIIRKMPTHVDKTAFIAHVLRDLSRAW